MMNKRDENDSLKVSCMAWGSVIVIDNFASGIKYEMWSVKNFFYNFLFLGDIKNKFICKSHIVQSKEPITPLFICFSGGSQNRTENIKWNNI